MRDEDLKNLPQSIERWKFGEMLEALGFGKGAQNNIRDMWVDRDGVHAVVYATDADGKRYFTHTVEQVEVTQLGDVEPVEIDGRTVSEAATHEISIPFVGKWKRPDDLAARLVESVGCQSHPVGEYAALRCERRTGHGGQHVAWNGQDSDVRWGSNSGQQICGYGWCRLEDGHAGEHDPGGGVVDAEFVPCGTTDGHGRACVLGRKHGGVHDFGPQEACGAWKKLGGHRMVCLKEPGHEMDHDYTHNSGRILGDAPQA